MQIRPLHSWDLAAAEASALQKQLAARLDLRTPLGPVRRVAGADLSFALHSDDVHAGVVVLSYPELDIVERQCVAARVNFPYIPGLLSFRETPPLLQAFARLHSKPDVVMIDGAGYAHPRRCGYASHVGLWLGIPTVGCAKTRLTGTYEEPGREAGSVSPLLDRGEEIGAVVRTKTGIKPLFVSVGSGIQLDDAVRLVLDTCRGYRIPEPTRQAHLYVNALRRGEPC